MPMFTKTVSFKAIQTTLCLSALLFVLSGCEENRLEVDVSHIETNVNIQRWDSSWFAMTPVTYRELRPEWEAQNPEFFKRYVQDILRLGSVEDSNLFRTIRSFVTDPSILQVHQEVQKTFPDLTDLQIRLNNAWKHYLFYFPEKQIPSHISIEGGFNVPLALTENEIGIPLEMYLGQDCQFYDMLYPPIPAYMKIRMNEEHLPFLILKSWMETEYLVAQESPTLLDEIIHAGKVLYCLDAFFPDATDAQKIQFTEDQMQWANAHEQYVWAHFVDEQILFTSDVTEIGKFTRDGPFTVDLVKESPARMGHYIGWQIVKAYMEKQEKVDLKALMLEIDSKKILSISKYKP